MLSKPEKKGQKGENYRLLSLLNLSTEIQQNVRKPKTLKQNQIKTLPRFIKSYTPQPSEMYSRYERLVQHTNCTPQISEI